MGYLIGFLVTIFFAGRFNYQDNLIFNFIKLTFATSFIYILGMLWLGVLIGWDKPIFTLGAQPFLLAELFKILLASFFFSITNLGPTRHLLLFTPVLTIFLSYGLYNLICILKVEYNKKFTQYIDELGEKIIREDEDVFK